jgi:hypothetical protein
MGARRRLEGLKTVKALVCRPLGLNVHPMPTQRSRAGLQLAVLACRAPALDGFRETRFSFLAENRSHLGNFKRFR